MKRVSKVEEDEVSAIFSFPVLRGLPLFVLDGVWSMAKVQCEVEQLPKWGHLADETALHAHHYRSEQSSNVKGMR